MTDEYTWRSKHLILRVVQGTISNMQEENVVQPLLVSLSALNLATECVRMMLKIDGIVSLLTCTIL